MAQYIDKSALVAEIERRIKEHHSGYLVCLKDILSFLDTLEVTESPADAFIEKACVKLKKLMYDNLMFQGRLHREEVIDNFVEDFKNYIKGE